jgi:hypothetical protein
LADFEVLDMAKLDAADRKKLPAKEFAEPKDRKYPVEDKPHAADAKGRAKQQLKKGAISEKEYAKIVAAANAVLAHEGVTHVSVSHESGGASGHVSMSKQSGGSETVGPA